MIIRSNDTKLPSPDNLREHAKVIEWLCAAAAADDDEEEYWCMTNKEYIWSWDLDLENSQVLIQHLSQARK